MGWVEVAHGHTMADLDRAARMASAVARSWSADVEWRYQIAWSSIAEALWAADEPPHPRDLVNAGKRAIDKEMRREQHHHGCRREEIGGGIMAAAVIYWWDQGRPTSGLESVVIERVALGQILAALSERDAQTLHALAVHGTHSAAAMALKLSEDAFQARLGRARGQFLALWHEGEKAPAVWRVDRRTPGRKGRTNYRSAVRRTAPDHGTATRYFHHGCRCMPCSTAGTQDLKARRQAAIGTPTRTITAARFARLMADRETGMTNRELSAKYSVGAEMVRLLLRGDRLPWPDDETAAS
jgi:hypothetical protein